LVEVLLFIPVFKRFRPNRERERGREREDSVVPLKGVRQEARVGSTWRKKP